MYADISPSIDVVHHKYHNSEFRFSKNKLLLVTASPLLLAPLMSAYEAQILDLCLSSNAISRNVLNESHLQNHHAKVEVPVRCIFPIYNA